jgi:hypothetical protein
MNRSVCAALAIAGLSIPVSARGQSDYQALGKSIFKTLIESRSGRTDARSSRCRYGGEGRPRGHGEAVVAVAAPP